MNGSTRLAIEAGKADRQTVSIAGSGDYQAAAFRTDNADITIDGSADATVFVEKRLNATLAGSSNLSWRGHATLSQQLSGSASVERID